MARVRRQQAAQWTYDMALYELEKVLAIEKQLEQQQHTLPDAPALINDAQRRLQSANGDYRFENLTVGNANLQAFMTGYEPAANGVFINGTNTLNFSLRLPPFARSGSGSPHISLPKPPS